ncbi:unnamed protein product [Caenorhabditis auriculariae]|uniref:Uncharacterized protein n=1 Tax=Caenorhabditis auriculariae TaxID=2777116 RepID=A0A8S1HNI0_9PELO|nr:unnamed protein product [Caenorhabditis auriculariae]
MTGAIVGAAMFEPHGKSLQVPIFSEETGETLLNYDARMCLRETEIIRETCPGFPGISTYKHWSDYENFVYNCLNYSSPLFKEVPFKNMEATINQYRNGIDLPESLKEKFEEAMKIYTDVTNFIIGAGTRPNDRLNKIKFGNLLKAFQGHMKNAWNCHKKVQPCENPKLKFVAYSSQDWLLAGLLQIFGALDAALGVTVMPEYNSMVSKCSRKRSEVIKEQTELIDVTKSVKNCPKDQDYCPLTNFLSCCDNYLEKVPGESCRPLSNLTTKSSFPWGPRRYAGFD